MAMKTTKTPVVNLLTWVCVACCVSLRAEAPDWVVFPDKDWPTLTPEEAGIHDVDAWNNWVEATKKSSRGASFQGEDHSGDKWGVAITRGGYLIQTFGDPDYKHQTASLGKAFTIACLQLAIDEGLIKSANDLIKKYWTGEDQLNSRHKYMNEGHHNFLTFNHLKNHRGAFPITNGWSWKLGKNYDAPAPEWATCTRDPDHDNYAHAKPGTVGHTYSSGGYWRLAQALTAVWKKDLKQVLDEKIMTHIGIPAKRWDWTAGQVVHDTKDWYPKMPGYGLFLDPPYSINGQAVRGGPGWVVMSPKDLARWGLLVATAGEWKGRRLISRIQGHGGGNGSHVGGTGGTVLGSWGRVTSAFQQSRIPWKLFNKPPKRSSIVVARERVVTVSMRDGVTIKTYVRTPSGDGPWPAVLKKGYGITRSGADTFINAGYAFVAQGVRDGADPHGISGNARFFADDVDGYDTIEWIARQPWCDGNVAMFGPSYYGATQWLAAANADPGPPPHLKAIIPSVINPDFWERAYRAHGAMNLSMTAISRAFGRNQASYDAYMSLPLIDMDKAVSGRENTLWNEYVSHWTYDDYWARIGMRDKYQRIKIPVYIYAGWWDYYSGASLKYYNLLRQAGQTPETRVWVGNSGHSQMSLSESIRWLDWVIKRKDNGMKDQPRVRLFVQGINKEQHYDHWPPSGIEYAKYYLHSPDGSRIGTLDTKPPGTETATQYTYDPRNPVPSIGGNANHRGVNKTLRSGAVLREGSFDQRPVETRDDVLVFTTPTLEENLEVIGPVFFKLHAATDARDTDFTVVLIDVLPDGKAMNVTEGIMRARFCESIWDAPKLLEPGRMYEYTVELLPTARVFRKGHKIRMHLSSSRFPLWDRNTNTGNNPATDTQTKVARQTIYHDAAHPSHLVLPVRSKNY